MSQQGEPPPFVQWILWVFRKDTWAKHPFPALITVLIIIATIYAVIRHEFHSTDKHSPNPPSLAEKPNALSSQEAEGDFDPTYAKFEILLNKQQAEIERLKSKYDPQIKDLEEAQAENHDNQKRFEESYNQSMASYELQIRKLDALSDELPPNVIKEGKQRLQETFQPNNEALAKYKNSISRNQIIFPLTGFENKRVRAKLYDNDVQDLHLLGEKFDPKELILTNLIAEHWYMVIIEEYDDTNESWNVVHTSWFRG